MIKKQNRKSQPQDIPIQIRPGADLAEMIDAKANAWKVSRNEAAKALIALAAAGLDSRYYEAIFELANGASDVNAFARYCRMVRDCVVTARASNAVDENERTGLIGIFIHDLLANKGIKTAAKGPWNIDYEETPELTSQVRRLLDRRRKPTGDKP